ncbi:hypothetical protein ABPG72_014921 [Tetrahymena utriculariae]
MGQSQYRKNKKKCLELMKKESYKEALQILQTLESNNLKNKSEISEFISFQRGLCYMALKQNRDAIQQFEKCNSKQSKINIGLMKIKLNQLDEAKDYFQNLIRNSRYKNNPYVLQLYGYCILVGDKDYHYAAQIFEQSVSLENKLFSAYHNLSLCYLSLREVEKAKYFLEKSLSINPNFELSLELKKLIYLQFVQEQNFDEDNYFEVSNIIQIYKKIDFKQLEYNMKFENQQYLLGKLDSIYLLKKEYCTAANALLTSNQQIDIQQKFEGFDCLYYSYQLIRVKEFLNQRPSKLQRNISNDHIIQQNIQSGVTVCKIQINQNVYLKKEFELIGQGQLFSYIPQWLINELLIGSFCLGRYLNYNLFYDCYQDQNKNSYVVIYSNYYQEGSLSKYLQNNELTKFQKQQIVFKIINGLHQLHSKSVNHLDLKLQNIVVHKSQRGESIDPIIIDYGASIVNLNPLDLIYSKKQEIIAFQQIQFLTPSYKIPEDKVDSRSDIFNLGKIILEVYSNSGLILLQDFQIDTSRLKKDEISNQLLNYIQEEIRNKDIFERPSTELILYQFQKDYLFDLIHSCLIDQSLMDYQMFMASMYNHFEQFWIEFFLGQNDQQQIEQQTSTNFIIENKQLFSIFKLYKIIDNELLTEILFDNRLMYYFTHGVLNFLPIEKADLEDLVLNIQIKKKISQYENQKLKVQIELERNIFKDIISQINKKEQKGLESSFISQIQVEEQKEGSQTQGYQNINQYYTEAINQIKQQITDDYIQNQFLQNIRTVAQKFQQNEINFQSQDITQMYLQENTYDYFNK